MRTYYQLASAVMLFFAAWRGLSNSGDPVFAVTAALLFSIKADTCERNP